MNLKFFKIIILLFFCSYHSVNAYHHEFIVENKWTKRTRWFFHTIFSVDPNDHAFNVANGTNRIERNPSHAVFLGTPIFISKRTETSNKAALAAREKMIAKKKTQKKIDKELKKDPFRYYTVTIPNWNKGNYVSIFLTSISQGTLFGKEKPSSKVPTDINIVDESGNVVCKSTEKLKTIKLTENDMRYVQKIYAIDKLISGDTISIKYYDPQCLIKAKAEFISLVYETKKGKKIFTQVDLDLFKPFIKNDFTV